MVDPDDPGDTDDSDVPGGLDEFGDRDATEGPDGESVGWSVSLRAVTESVVTTLGPNGRWNCAALGLSAGDGCENGDPGSVTARTWGRTRTWHNFDERGEGYVQFVRDPVVFVESALSIVERDDPLLPAADAWVRVEVEPIDAGTSEGTKWVEWRLEPRETAVRSRTVPTINRGHNAVIEATVAASRLDVDAYDADELRGRIEFFEAVIERCGGPRERAAAERLAELTSNP